MKSGKHEQGYKIGRLRQISWYHLLEHGAVIVLVFVLVWTYVFYLPGKSYSDVTNAYPFLDPGRSFLETKNLIVDLQSLREELQSRYENHPDYLISFYFEYLPTGANISIGKDTAIWPASLIKVPVAMAVLKKVERGEWKLTNELVILDDDKDEEFGALYKEPSGTRLTIERLIRESLIPSDNTAHFVLLRNLDASELEEIYLHFGFDDILEVLKRSPGEETTDNRITAKRYSIFFRSLYNATYLSPEFSEMLLKILSEGGREFLGAALPPEVLFANKTGVRSKDSVLADSGIVYVPGRPYLMTVMMQKKDKASDDKKAEDLFREISEKIYTYVANYK